MRRPRPRCAVRKTTDYTPLRGVIPARRGMKGLECRAAQAQHGCNASGLSLLLLWEKTMLDKCKPVGVSIVFGAAALLAAPAPAHPPHSPYDATVFAPIKRFGPRIAVEVLASGLVAPLKGVTA